jgi:hypothetical protein
MSAQLTNALESLIEKWKQRAHVAAATDAMLINKHIRELTEALRMAEAALRARGEPIPLEVIRKWPEGFDARLQHVWLDVIGFIPNVKLYDLKRTLAEFGFEMTVREAPHPQGEEHGG